METHTIKVGGMSCQHCVGRVERALDELDGVRVDGVTVGSAAVSFDDERVALEDVLAAIRSVGYTA